MATYSKVTLSGSADGRGIKVADTGTPGTTIHMAPQTDLDEIWLWAVNSDTADRKLTIEFGGTTSPDDLIEFTVKAEDGLKCIVPGLILTNQCVVKAFAAAANLVVIFGFVNRISA